MKKAQILSAIALAFALGVVAPVAGANAIDPRTTVTTPEDKEDTATVAEVNNTINSIKAQPEYQAYVALNNANKDTATYTSEADQQTAIAAAYKNYTGNDYDGADTYAATLAAAKGVENYSKWAALVDAMEATDNGGTTSAEQQAKAIIAAGETLGYKFTDLDEDWNTVLTDVKDEINKDTNGYVKAKTFVNAVSGAEKALTASNTSIANLKNALAGVKVDARDIETAATDAAPITALKALADAQLKTTRGAAYVTLIGEVDAAKADADDLEANYTLIESLKASYKTAAGTDLVVTDTPTDPTTPGEDGDDTTTDPSAPGTGVLSSADGNAATTVSIVAGLATALTALGAGVVAYRSARRSSEK